MAEKKSGSPSPEPAAERAVIAAFRLGTDEERGCICSSVDKAVEALRRDIHRHVEAEDWFEAGKRAGELRTAYRFRRMCEAWRRKE